MAESMIKNPPEVLLGFDFGTKRIGVAIGQTVTRTARPLTMIPADAGTSSWDAIKKLIKDWNPDALIVGIPLNMDGTTQPLTDLAKQFIASLKQQCDLPIYEVDERLTSVIAKDNVFKEGGYRALKKTQIDSIAAQMILQSWLDQH
jgi:putative Holliday junction resolvase